MDYREEIMPTRAKRLLIFIAIVGPVLLAVITVMLWTRTSRMVTHVHVLRENGGFVEIQPSSSWLRTNLRGEYVPLLDNIGRVQVVVSPANCRAVLKMVENLSPRSTYVVVSESSPVVCDEITRVNNLVGVRIIQWTEEARCIAAASDLRSLHLGSSTFGDTHLAWLSQFTSLEELDLSGTAVTDAGLSSARLPATLRVVAIRDTNVGDEGASHLKVLSELIAISLDRTQITEDTVGALLSLPELRYLSVSETNVPIAACEYYRRGQNRVNIICSQELEPAMYDEM